MITKQELLDKAYALIANHRTMMTTRGVAHANSELQQAYAYIALANSLQGEVRRVRSN